MLFRRRTPPGIGEKFRVWIWPRRGWLRSGQYISKRILRLTDSPHTIAAGVAVGVFISFTPFLGFHFLLAFALAFVVAGNMIAAALGTFVGNPLTFPFIWASTFSLGRLMLGETSTAATPFKQLAETTGRIRDAVWQLDFGGFTKALAEIWQPLLKPMLFGGVTLGLCAALVSYLITRRMAVYFNQRRKKRLQRRAGTLQDHANNLNIG